MANPVNFHTNQNFSRSVAQNHNQNLSKWQICKLIITHMHTEGTLWKNIALAVGTLVLSVFTVWLAITGLTNIMDIWDKLSQANWVVTTYQYGISSSNPLSVSHLVQACFSTILAVPFFALIPLSFYSSLKENMEEAYSQALRRDFE